MYLSGGFLSRIGLLGVSSAIAAAAAAATPVRLPGSAAAILERPVDEELLLGVEVGVWTADLSIVPDRRGLSNVTATVLAASKVSSTEVAGDDPPEGCISTKTVLPSEAAGDDPTG